jgi:hypothetical protein
LLLTVATLAADEVQVTLVSATGFPVWYVPIAVSWRVFPTLRFDVLVVIDIETKLSVTAKVPDPLVEPEAATMLAWPTATAVAMPVLVTLMTLLAVELQATLEVRSFELPSLYFPVAVHCCEVPTTMELPLGATVIDTNEALGVGLGLVVLDRLPLLPQPASQSNDITVRNHKPVFKRMREVSKEILWGGHLTGLAARDDLLRGVTTESECNSHATGWADLATYFQLLTSARLVESEKCCTWPRIAAEPVRFPGGLGPGELVFVECTLASPQTESSLFF